MSIAVKLVLSSMDCGGLCPVSFYMHIVSLDPWQRPGTQPPRPVVAVAQRFSGMLPMAWLTLVSCVLKSWHMFLSGCWAVTDSPTCVCGMLSWLRAVWCCSFAGILDVFMHPVMLAEKLWGWGKWRREWEVADVLVLDEISMVDCDLLETVREYAVMQDMTEMVRMVSGQAVSCRDSMHCTDRVQPWVGRGRCHGVPCERLRVVFSLREKHVA